MCHFLMDARATLVGNKITSGYNSYGRKRKKKDEKGKNPKCHQLSLKLGEFLCVNTGFQDLHQGTKAIKVLEICWKPKHLKRKINHPGHEGLLRADLLVDAYRLWAKPPLINPKPFLLFSPTLKAAVTCRRPLLEFFSDVQGLK